MKNRTAAASWKVLMVSGLLALGLSGCGQPASDIPGDISKVSRLEFVSGQDLTLSNLEPEATIQAIAFDAQGKSLGEVPVQLTSSSSSAVRISGGKVTGLAFPANATITASYGDVRGIIHVTNVNVRQNVKIVPPNTIKAAEPIPPKGYTPGQGTMNLVDVMEQAKIKITLSDPEKYRTGMYIISDKYNFAGIVEKIEGNTATVGYAPLGEIYEKADFFAYQNNSIGVFEQQKLKALAVETECKDKMEKSPPNSLEISGITADLTIERISLDGTGVSINPLNAYAAAYLDFRGVAELTTPKIKIARQLSGEYTCKVKISVPGASLPGFTIPKIMTINFGLSLGAELEIKVAADGSVTFDTGKTTATARVAQKYDTRLTPKYEGSASLDIEKVKPSITTSGVLSAEVNFGPTMTLDGKAKVFGVGFDIEAVKIKPQLELEAKAEIAVKELGFNSLGLDYKRSLSEEIESPLLNNIGHSLNKHMEKFGWNIDLPSISHKRSIVIFGLPKLKVDSNGTCSDRKAVISLEKTGINSTSSIDRAILYIKEPGSLLYKKLGESSKPGMGSYIFPISNSLYGSGKIYAAVITNDSMGLPLMADVQSIDFEGCNSQTSYSFICSPRLLDLAGKAPSSWPTATCKAVQYTSGKPSATQPTFNYYLINPSDKALANVNPATGVVTALGPTGDVEVGASTVVDGKAVTLDSSVYISGGSTTTPNPNPTVSVKVTHGTVTPSSLSVVSGNKATFTATPDKGYGLPNPILLKGDTCTATLTGLALVTSNITNNCLLNLDFRLAGAPPLLNMTATIAPSGPVPLPGGIKAITIPGFVDSAGKPVNDLTGADVTVVEDGFVIPSELIRASTTTSIPTDIVFVFDTTGSMAGAIAGVKNSIIAFANNLESKGLDVRIGAVTFGDAFDTVGSPTGIPGGVALGTPSTPPAFDRDERPTLPLTNNFSTFRNFIGANTARAGGDGPENGLGATVFTAKSMSWRPGAAKVIIMITDVSQHQSGTGTIPADTRWAPPSLASALTTLKGKATVHVIGPVLGATGSYVDMKSLTGTAGTGGTFINLNTGLTVASAKSATAEVASKALNELIANDSVKNNLNADQREAGSMATGSKLSGLGLDLTALPIQNVIANSYTLKFMGNENGQQHEIRIRIEKGDLKTESVITATY